MQRKVKLWTGNLRHSPQVSHLKRILLGQLHLILNFHRIRQENEEMSDAGFDTCPSIPDDKFRQVLFSLRKHYQIVPLKTLVENLSSREPLAAITFDDGWRDNYELGFPILQELDVPATIFITTNKLGATEPFWQQKLGAAFKTVIDRIDTPLESALRNLIHLDQKSPLNKGLYIQTVKKWKLLRIEDIHNRLSTLPLKFRGQEIRLFLNQQEILEMSQKGIEFGTHTVDHVILTNESEKKIIFQLAESKKHLENLLQKPVYALAYPNGNFSPNIVRITKELGYTLGCSTKSRKLTRHEKLFELPRIDVSLNNWEKFLRIHL